MVSIASASNGDRHTGFARNWIGGASEGSWTQRRRLMAVLRRAHRVLGVNREVGARLAGRRRHGSARLLAVGIMAPQAAFGQTVIGNGVPTNVAQLHQPLCRVGNGTAIGCGSNATGTAQPDRH